MRNKLILPCSILLTGIILGWFIYTGITERENSISATKRLEYIGQRKKECYEILEKERRQFSNATDVEYFEPSSNPFEGKGFNDSCRVSYKNTQTGETFYKSY